MIETDEILTEDGTQYMKRIVESTYYKTGERDEMDCKHYSKEILIKHYIIKHYKDGKQPTIKIILDILKDFEYPEMDFEKEGVILYLRNKNYLTKDQSLEDIEIRSLNEIDKS